MSSRRIATAAAALALIAASTVPAAQAAPAPAAPAPAARLVYPHLALPDGAWASVYSDGLATVHRGARTAVQRLPLPRRHGHGTPPAARQG